jgi:hypothetical protein
MEHPRIFFWKLDFRGKTVEKRRFKFHTPECRQPHISLASIASWQEGCFRDHSAKFHIEKAKFSVFFIEKRGVAGLRAPTAWAYRPGPAKRARRRAARAAALRHINCRRRRTAASIWDLEHSTDSKQSSAYGNVTCNIPSLGKKPAKTSFSEMKIHFWLCTPQLSIFATENFTGIRPCGSEHITVWTVALC